MLDYTIIKQSIKCGCPKCGSPSIFKHRLTLDTKDRCETCDLNLKDHDSGDGPAVFLIFILGFILTPLALWVGMTFEIPLWGHTIIWTIASLVACVLTMQPLKAYVIALNYKHRQGAKGV